MRKMLQHLQLQRWLVENKLDKSKRPQHKNCGLFMVTEIDKYVTMIHVTKKEVCGLKQKGWFKNKLFSKKSNKLPLPVIKEEETEKIILDPDWIGNPMTKEEEELVAAVATSIVAGNQPDSYFRICKIIPIDEDYELAGVLCATIAAGERPDSSFRVNRIQRVK